MQELSTVAHVVHMLRMQKNLLLTLHIQGAQHLSAAHHDQELAKLICEIYRTHLYGDIYSSPGLEMRQKQLLMVAFLGQANMPDELFGHAVAVSPSSKHVCRDAVHSVTPC